MPGKNAHLDLNLNAPTCEITKCRTNCRKNPNCFVQLGEKFWFNPIKEGYWFQHKDPEEERKEKNLGHVGLKNLGATCYVNTFLQLWFRNKPLRSAIYQWKNVDPPNESVESYSDDESDPLKISKYISLTFSDDSTKAICGSLQYLFTQLQYSERRYVDPSPFVRSLGLQTDEQQDAQEFSKLFISLLQDALSSQGLDRIIEDQFGGSYVYETICRSCQSTSERYSKFYELDLNIKGHIKLIQCLKEFLKEELLEGDNQYFCSTCRKKQNATRSIKLKKLPRVLNLQLLRFVFDRKTFTKKKLSNTINFPEILDMNDFMDLQNTHDGIYHLKAVLIHKGLSANSGHYIAHILDQGNEMWCRFNDEDVGVVKGKTLQLEKDDELPTEEKTKIPKGKKMDGYNSKNAYMLVYTRVKDTEENFDIEPPDCMTEVVVKDNSLFEEWKTYVQNLRKDSLAQGTKKQTEIQSIFASLPVKEGAQDYEWISTKWLRTWLNPDQDVIPPIDNTELMCVHSCIDPTKLHLMKRVSVKASDRLFEKHGGLPRFKNDAMCKKCIEFIKEKFNFEQKLQDDLKWLQKHLKVTVSDKAGYWVGKKSIKQFKQLATKEFLSTFDMDMNSSILNGIKNHNNTDLEYSSFQNTLPDENCTNKNQSIHQTSSANISNNQDQTATNLSSNNNNNQNQVATSQSDGININNNNNNDDEDQKNDMSIHKSKLTNKNHSFNQEVTCSEHGNLALNDNNRRLVSGEVWKKYLEYFPTLEEFTCTSPVCVECHKRQITAEEEKKTMKLFVANQKQCLSFLYDNPIERLERFLQQDTPSSMYLVTSSFVNTWKKKIKKQKSLEAIDNSDMICEHDLLLYSSEELVDELLKKNPEVIMVTPEEKQILSNFFVFAPEVKIAIRKTKNNENDTTQTTYECTPDYCSQCRNSRLSEEAFDMKCFSSAPIYIRKLTKEQTSRPPDDSTGKIGNTENTNHNQKEDEVYKEHSPKRFKSSADNPDEHSKRRSTRHRKQRDEYMVYVESHQTLKELKVQLLSIFSVFPLEQILTFTDGTLLAEDDKFLVDLGVTPGKHLLLSAMEQDKNQMDVEQEKERPREEGFKGTNLMCKFNQQ